MLKKLFIGLDNNLTYNYIDTLNTSIRCSSCKLLNSFSFDTNRTTCIRCNFRLSQEDINNTIVYKENKFNQFKDQNYNNVWTKND